MVGLDQRSQPSRLAARAQTLLDRALLPRLEGYGFDLEATKLIHTHRLHTLLSAMATTTLWMVHVGQWVTRTGRRPLLEALHKCDYSIFRLGRDYTCRSQVMDWPLPVGFTVNSGASS